MAPTEPSSNLDEAAAPQPIESLFLSGLKASLQQRMDELRPLVEEERRLRAAMEELDQKQRSRR